MAKTPKTTEQSAAPEADPVFEQGVEAAALFLATQDCPYAEGANRDAWLFGYETKAKELEG